MAKRSRRSATFPPHDPRAIKAALRRELYEVGDSLRQLDDIEFAVCRETTAQAIRPIVNGRDLCFELRHWPLWATQNNWHVKGLTDADGDRRPVAWTSGGNPPLHMVGAQLRISVAGRYVRWIMGEELGHETFVFDRATYRERQQAMRASALAEDTPELRISRELSTWGPWAGFDFAGIGRGDLTTTAPRRYAILKDKLWDAFIEVDLGRSDLAVEEVVPRAISMLARWDLNEMQVQWYGAVRPPHFPEHWVERPRH